MSSVDNNLKEMLSRLFDDIDGDLLNDVGRILELYLQNNSISYKNIKHIVEDDVMDAMLFLSEKKLLIPQQSSHGTLEWSDSFLNTSPEEKYNMPQITRELLNHARVCGVFNIEEIVRKKFKNIEDPNYKEMPDLLRRLLQMEKHLLVNGRQIRSICEDKGIEARIDSIVSELKGMGIMSPVITRGLFSAVKSKTPQYELNPILVALYKN